MDAASERGGGADEARLMVRMREAHSKALHMAAAKLPPEACDKLVRSVKGKVDADAAVLAANVVARVVEKSEEGFAQLCRRMSVNDKLLSLERQTMRRDNGTDGSAEYAVAAEEEDGDVLTDASQIRPLPGGRRPDELMREATMRLKMAERARLLGLAEEAERAAEAEALKVAEVEKTLEKLLREVNATRLALTEAASSLS